MTRLPVEPVAACSCGSRELAPPARGFRLGGERFGLRRCLRCRRMLLDPRPRSEAIASCYDDGYYGSGPRKFIPWIERVVDRFREGRARVACRLLRRMGKERGGRVLDIGCGSGQFLARLIRSGHEGHGTELNAESGRRAIGIPGLRLHVGELESDRFPPESFDLISIWHVLEHLPEPDRILGFCRLWLTREGALMIAVPNIDSWQAGLFGGSWFHLAPPRHLHHFGRRSLGHALRDAGFRVERMRTLSWEQNVYGIAQSTLNALGFPRDEAYEVLKGNRSPWSSPRLGVELLLLAIILPAAFLFTLVESSFGRGGTLECIARPERSG